MMYIIRNPKKDVLLKYFKYLKGRQGLLLSLPFAAHPALS